ncbi:GNAT family N-acetyltransferase [Vibrio ordalii]|uniref:Ribosomal-protein-L7/L12-serine acetyltransferase n=1 Tax=Vibrio ordalii FS-238 TaxID=617133 RepID=A0A853R5Q2_9VIBR|nr:GNAT family N-acetyltransferase [Vibrio ordalii]OEE37556.1 ribosomal-protein-L7/L12-serine acetyltransferase [Vibrio ordalii FS-238]
MFTVEVEEGLELALIDPKFASKYFDIVSNQRDYLSEWLAWPVHAENEEFFLNFIKKSLHDYADGKSLVCAMMFNNEVAGNISFNTINHDLQKVEIGYWLRCDLQGKGIVSKSLSKLINYAFTGLDMQKVQISAAVDNQASRSVCERLGFKLEGIITRAENLNGRVVDHAVYGLSRTIVAQT